MKELLKVVQIKGSICQISCDIHSQNEKEMVASAILGAMAKDEELALAICSACASYLTKRSEVEKLTEVAVQKGKIKTQN